MEYSFTKDYKEHPKRRESFFSLAKDTFGIDLAGWFSRGFWNDNYVCYGFEYDGEIVSNVSINIMRLITQGRERKALQIGTVMTRKDHRRRGLAKQLLSRAIDDYKGDEFFFLDADEEAVPLYESCGFALERTYRFFIDMKGYGKSKCPLAPVHIAPQELLEAKRSSLPLSRKLSAAGDEHVLMFYYVNGFSEHIYRFEDAYVIMRINGDTLHLFDILSPRRISVEELISAVAPAGMKQAECHFAPDDGVKALSILPDPGARWMMRGGRFPGKACFPDISRT